MLWSLRDILLLNRELAGMLEIFSFQREKLAGIPQYSPIGERMRKQVETYSHF